MVKDQVVAAYVGTTLSKYPLLRASCCSFSCSSFESHIIPSLVLFLHFLTIFFYFTLILRCHNQRMERINWISRPRTLCWIFWEKSSLTKSNILEAPQIPWFSRCNHQQPCNVFSVFANFQTLAEVRKTKIGWFEAEELSVTGTRFSIISKGKIFGADRKKSLYC